MVFELIHTKEAAGFPIPGSPRYMFNEVPVVEWRHQTPQREVC